MELEDIIERCKNGERQAQSWLYMRYSQQMLRICYRLVADKPHMLKLVADILDISNLESDCMEIQEIHLNEICQEVLQTASQLIQSTVALQYEPEDCDLLIQTDARNLQRLLFNVMNNSVKFTSAGSVKLQTCLRGETVHITVTDTGIGIPPEKAEWVFERFAKVYSYILGAGLGLSISRLIATSLGGKIYVDTEYTEGCRMKIELPISPN